MKNLEELEEVSYPVATKTRKGIPLPPFQQGIRRLGPTLILATVTIGPGSVFLTIMAGATFGYSLLWLVILAMAFMMVYVEMFARIGILSKISLFSLVREKFGNKIGVLGGIIGLITCFGFQTGNITGAGATLSAMFGGSFILWSCLLVALAILFLSLRNLYKKIQSFVYVFIFLMLISFVGTVIITGFSATGAVRGLVPSFPSQEAVYLGIALMATTFTLYGAIYQTYLVKEKGYQEKDLGYSKFDNYTGMIGTVIVLIVIMLSSAAVLHTQNIIPESPMDMAIQLEPVAGIFSTYLFGFGVFAAAFSSIVVNAMLGSVLFSDGIGKGSKMSSKTVKNMGIGITVIAFLIAAVPSLLGFNAINTVIASQFITIIALPLYGFIAIKFSNDPSIVGEYVNSRPQNVMALLGYLLCFVIVIYYVFNLFIL